MSNTAQCGMIGDNAIVALGCIIGAVCKQCMRKGSNFRLEDSEERRVSAIGSTVDGNTTF